MQVVRGSLFREILMRPAANEEADELLIVSGYVSAGMLEQHLEALREGVKEGRVAKLPRIDVVVGMAQVGIEAPQHHALCKIVGQFHETASCSYLTRGNPCHSKVFVWKKKGIPTRAFVGSANYTLTGFGDSQRETVVEADPDAVLKHHESLIDQSIPCTDAEVETSVKLMHTKPPEDVADEDAATLSLLATKGDRKGDTHLKAGLNWGQRNDRDPDQAYIPIPKLVRDQSFFPPIGERFTVLTDDGQSLILVVAQQYGKALHTTMDNSELGRYFRKRLGVRSGEFVTRQHLTGYGRHDVGFYRIDPETYHMDFRPNLQPIDTLERLEE